MTARGSSTAKQFNIDGCLENFQRFLYKSADDKTRTDNFLLQLQEELESLIVQVTNQFSVQRTEVTVETVSLYFPFALYVFYI